MRGAYTPRSSTSTGAIPEGLEKAAIAFQCDLTQISPNSRRETIVPRDFFPPLVLFTSSISLMPPPLIDRDERRPPWGPPESRGTAASIVRLRKNLEDPRGMWLNNGV